MTLNLHGSPTWLSKAARSLSRGATGIALLVAAGGVTAGCLKRPVVPAKPTTTNVYIDQIRSTGVDKIDLLFMLDNSISMADKQEILADAVPVLVQRLITPACVDTNGNVGPQGTNGSCGAGFASEFKPIQNIHIGIITSSLGDHGSHDVCSKEQDDANFAGGEMRSDYNDAAQLLPTVRTTVTPPLVSYNNTGFLVWDPRDYKQVPVGDQLNPPPGMNEKDAPTFINNFKNQVIAAGEHGCGYEASLEAWYRFLVDPQPVSSMDNDKSNSVRPTTVNQVVLDERAKFLRPDSLLAVVMMSDENDCSIVDENGVQGWLVGFKGGVVLPAGQNPFHMPRAKSICATDPNSASCGPCNGLNDPDPACAAGGPFLTANEDNMNMRCFNQVQRFGVNLLYDTGRYVEGLSQKNVHPRFGGPAVPNPIYSTTGGAVARDPALVFFAGIVGVPWQDVATEDSWAAGTRQLTYLNETDLAAKGRWDVILGPNGNDPKDTLMVESIDPRSGTQYPQQHPLIPTISIQPPTATGQQANPINGHEQLPLSIRDDLQFACTFQLATPVPCTDANADGCDCNHSEFPKDSPLCQGVTATADGTQNYAKAYPGIRELQVLKGYGANAIVASICPKNTTAMGDKSADANYGYNPAVAAIIERLKEALTVKCLPRPLTPTQACTADNQSDCTTVAADVGKVPCAVVEVRPEPMDGTTTCTDLCAQPGREDLANESAKIIPAAKEYLKNTGYCGSSGQTSCDSYCYCKIDQFTDVLPDGTEVDANNNALPDLTECKTAGTDPGNLYGYCYVDPDTETDPMIITGEEALVKSCKSSDRRILRFLGQNLPAKDGLAFIACIGAAASDD